VRTGEAGKAKRKAQSAAFVAWAANLHFYAERLRLIYALRGASKSRLENAYGFCGGIGVAISLPDLPWLRVL
jgi:hypothetical protein